jgi:hypothetical protein
VKFERGLLLCHVPKTGGISVRSAIEEVYPQHLRLGAYTVAEFDRVPDEALVATRVVSCHLRSWQRQRLFRFSTVPWVEGFFLRDPIDHYVSHVAFVRKSPDHHYHEIASRHSMTELLDHPELQPGYSRFQSWYLRLAYALPAALQGGSLLEQVETRVAVVGTTTHLLAGYLRLCYWAGRTPVTEFPWLNRRADPTPDETAEEAAVRADPRLVAMTADDRELHRSALNRSTAQFEAFLRTLGLPAIPPDNEAVAASYSRIVAAVAAAVAGGPPALAFDNR